MNNNAFSRRNFLKTAVTAPLGARYCNALTGKKLKIYFGAFLIFCSALLFLKPYLTNFIGTVPGYAKIIILLSTGALTGFLSGMMGVGGGTIHGRLELAIQFGDLFMDGGELGDRSGGRSGFGPVGRDGEVGALLLAYPAKSHRIASGAGEQRRVDRKSTRLNSSH